MRWQLALFDLDHTLIPFDSGLAWTEWLAAQDVLPADAPQRHLDLCREYVAGRQDIRGLHRATVVSIAHLTPGERAGLAQGFATAMSPRLPAASRALVARHLEAGHHCLLVTATTRFIAEVFVGLFGLHDLIATESAQDSAGRLTGELVGEPCWGPHKVVQVEAWLAHRQAPRLADCAFSAFYSDAASDLPLLQAVQWPVAVRPDARLRKVALERGWAVLDR